MDAGEGSHIPISSCQWHLRRASFLQWQVPQIDWACPSGHLYIHIINTSEINRHTHTHTHTCTLHACNNKIIGEHELEMGMWGRQGESWRWEEVADRIKMHCTHMKFWRKSTKNTCETNIAYDLRIIYQFSTTRKTPRPTDFEAEISEAR